MTTKKKTAEEPEVDVKVDPVEAALELEVPLRDAADQLPAGPNSDALKAAIRNASHGIAHIRKVLDVNARVAR